ncbi:hypothetical protein ACA910_004837 [Epithemia clementina (nom. ined.)]
MDRKTLEQVAGYLNPIAQSFPTIKLYLNGVYATMNAWQPNRDEEGWRLGRVEGECNDDPREAPKRVRMVSRIKFDIEALEGLTAAETPPERNIRQAKVGSLPRYCFADASGSGLGVLQWSPGDTEVKVDYGSWGDDIASNSSSNFRELGNIVEKIERMDHDGRLSDKIELFIFTNNYHAEAAFYWGTAKSPEVLQLMFRLHRVLIKGRAFIHVIWISGNRMIDQGT